MGIRIVSIGPSGSHVKVVDSKTDEPINGITSLRVRILPGQRTEAYMTMLVDSLDIEAEVVERPKEALDG